MTVTEPAPSPVELACVKIDATSSWPPRAIMSSVNVLYLSDQDRYFVAQIPIRVNNISVLALIDTGASITITSVEAMPLFGAFDLAKSDVTSAVIVETRLLFSVVRVLVMDDTSSPPDPGAAPDDQRRYSLTSSRDATDSMNISSSRDAAESSSIFSSRDAAVTQTNCPVSVEQESAMDTSETVASDLPEDRASATGPSLVSGTDSVPTAAGQASASETTVSVSFAEIASRNTWHSAKSSSLATSQRKFHSDKQLPNKSEEESVVSMTSSMGHLSVTEVAPLKPPPAPVAAPSFTPPAKVMRSSSGQRRQIAVAPTQVRGRGGARQPQSFRGSARGRAPPSSRSVASTSSASQPSTSRSSTRGAGPSRGSGTRRGRGAKTPPPTYSGPLPQVHTSQLPRETPKGFTHYLIDQHPWAHFVNPRPIHYLREHLPTVTTTLDTEVYRHLPDSGYLSARFNKSLFPQVVFKEGKIPNTIPFIEVQHLEDTIAFRARSKAIIDQLFA
ncbi:hypothetical protein OSTOST_25100, partial [Ostertagia ostertagi]